MTDVPDLREKAMKFAIGWAGDAEYEKEMEDELYGLLLAERLGQAERDAAMIDEAAMLRRKRAAEIDYDPDHTIAIKVAHELEFVAAAIRSSVKHVE